MKFRDRYTIAEKNYIVINGKEYLLLDSISDGGWGDEYIIVIAGRNALADTDLPKGYTYIRGRKGIIKIYIIYNESLFDYEKDNGWQNFVFVGMNLQGAYYAAYRQLCRLFTLKRRKDIDYVSAINSTFNIIKIEGKIFSAIKISINMSRKSDYVEGLK